MAKKKKSRSTKVGPGAKGATSAVDGPCHSPSTRQSSGLIRSDILFALMAILLPLLAYAPTLSQYVLLEDDGLFLAAGKNLGTAHPPGYPLYTILLWAFMKLPFATPALGGHALSAVLGALGCGALYWCGRLLRLSGGAALGCALLFGAQEHVWSQAIRAEVYSLNYLLIFAILGLALRVRQVPTRRLYWFFGAGLTGLAMAHHWPLFVLAVPGFAVILWPVWRYLIRQIIPLALVSLGVMAALYGWMIWRSLMDPIVSFSGEIAGLEEFWRYFQREDFQNVDNSESAGWSDRIRFIGWFLWQSAVTFTPVGGVLSLIGVWSLYRIARNVSIGLMIIWAGQSLLLLLLLNFDFDFFNIGVFRVYSLAAYGVQAIWLVFGIQALLSIILNMVDRVLSVQLRNIAIGFVCLVLLGFVVPSSFRVNDQSDFKITRNFATYILNKVPSGGILLVSGDFTTGTLAYYQLVEEMRPDVDVYHTSGLIINQGPFAGVRSEVRRQEIVANLLSQDRPIYVFSLSQAKTLCPSCSLHADGIIVRLHPDNLYQTNVSWADEDSTFLESVINQSSDDAWAQTVRRTRLLDFGRIAARLLSVPGPNREKIEGYLANPVAGPWILLGAVRELLENWDPNSLVAAQAWIAQAEERLTQEPLTKKNLALFYNQQGGVLFAAGQQEAAVQAFKASLEAWDTPENEAHDLIKQIQERR